MIELAKENYIRLNIEIKPSVNDTDIEKAVVDLIREMDFADSCVVSSQMYSCLEKVKEYDPEISTLYVMSLAYGNVNRLKAQTVSVWKREMCLRLWFPEYTMQENRSLYGQ